MTLTPRGDYRGALRTPRAGERNLKTNGCLGGGALRNKEKHDVVASLRHSYPLKTLLGLIGMSRSTYYYRETHEAADRQSLERPVIREICLVADMRYGYRRAASELKRRTGLCLSGKTVLKVMREEGLTCARRRRRKYCSYAGKVGKVALNLLVRSFRAAAPMTKLVTDVTELKVAGRKFYLSPVIDLFNDEVVTYSMSTSPNMRMVQELEIAVRGYIDWYNTRRVKMGLKGKSPVEYRLDWAA